LVLKTTNWFHYITSNCKVFKFA